MQKRTSAQSFQEWLRYRRLLETSARTCLVVTGLYGATVGSGADVHAEERSGWSKWLKVQRISQNLPTDSPAKSHSPTRTSPPANKLLQADSAAAAPSRPLSVAPSQQRPDTTERGTVDLGTADRVQPGIMSGRATARAAENFPPIAPGQHQETVAAEINAVMARPAGATAGEARIQLTTAETIQELPELPAIPPTPEASRAAADPNAMTLEMLTALVDAHHPRLTTAFQQVQAARGRAVQAGLYPNPVVAGSSPQWDGNESQFNGFVSQEIVTARKLKLDVAAIQREVSQAQFQWQRERLEILTALRTQFYTTLAAQRRVEVLESLVRIAQRSFATSEKLLKAGEGTRGEQLLFDIEVQRAEVALMNARTSFELGRRQLAILAAVPDLQMESLAGDFELPVSDYDPTELRFAVAAANPQANIARLEIDRNSYRLQRSTVEPIPNVDVMGGYQRQIGVPSENQGIFQVTMTVPLWNKNQGAIFAAQAELAGARADLQRVELDLGERATAALTQLRTTDQLVDRYDEQILPKARETLGLSQQLYDQGQVDFLQILQAQKTLLEAELSRIESIEQRWIAAITIAGLLQLEVFP